MTKRDETESVPNAAASAATSSVKVLIVDDDADAAATTASTVEDRDDRLDVTSASDAESAHRVLIDDAFDCVVSEYDLPDLDGTAFLETVRDRYGDLPFVLFTDAGSERVASEAIAAGVDGYLPKDADEAYAALAERIRRAVAESTRERRVSEHLDRMTDAFCGIDEDWRLTYLNERATEMLERDAADLLGESIWERFPDARGTALEDGFRTAMETGEPTTFEYHADDLSMDLAINAYPSDSGLSVYFRDVTAEREREREFHELSKRLRLAVEGADIAVWDWDLRTDEVRFDDRWAGMLGYDPAEIASEFSEWEDRVHPDDIDSAWSAFEAHFAGETEYYQCDYRMETKTDEWRWIRDRGRVVERDADGDPDRAVGVHIDVTAEKERERDLERYRRLVDEFPQSVCVYDAEARFVIVNENLAEMYDTSQADLVGRPSTLIERIREERGGDPFAALVDGDRETLSGTVELELPGRSELIVEYGLHRLVIAGEFDGVLAVSRDVTDSRRRRRRLEHTSARLEALYEGSPDMIDIHDTGGRIVDANRVMCAELGHERDEIVGMDVWDIDEEMEPAEGVELWEELDMDETVRLETTFTRADGSSFPVEVHVRRVDVQGEDRFLASSRDISDRKAYQRRIERENERLDEFASIVSHDLRNPLNVLSGYLRLARETGTDSYFERCERALTDMERLIEDVLTLARQGDAVGSVEAVSLDEFAARGGEDPFGAVADDDDTTDPIDVDIVVEARESVLADPTRLKRLLENLYRNAAEHGGDHVVVGDLPDGFYVADDGPGIPEDRRGEVFESGYTTSDDGTGFGLAIVERIAEAHGWRVTLAESDDGGARFEFVGVDRP